MYGRHFDLEDELVSHISRKSIDLLKANYRVSLLLSLSLSLSVSLIDSFGQRIGYANV